MSRLYQVISADGHLEFPPDPWIQHVPLKYRERAPRLLPLPAGGEGWLIEGQPLLNAAPTIAGGSPQAPGSRPVSYWNADGTPAPGTGDAHQRLREQDSDGIDAEVLFPPVMVTTAIQSIADKDVYRAIVRAYNRFLAEDYCAAARDRLIGCGVIPVTGIDDALAELEFCKGAGLKTIALNEFPAGGKGPSPQDDRFWQHALALGMPIAAHTHFGTRYPPFMTQGSVQSDANSAAAGMLTTRQVGFAPMYTFAQLIVSGVFDRFPDLRIYFAETNASWMACALWQMDDNHSTFARAGLLKTQLSRKPSEYFRKHLYCGFIRDPNVGRMHDLLPMENLMFGSDFPHSVTSYPDTPKWIDETFAAVPPGVRRMILVDTPARYFGLAADRPITATRH